VRGIVLALVMLGTVDRAAAGSDAFGRCLARSGVRYYWARWCPHCAAQAKLLGGAMESLNAVDCSRPGTRACRDADVHGFPTWTFRDGSRLAGVASLDELGRRTGCPLGDRRDGVAEVPHAAGGVRTHERTVGGMTIIEVPPR
jgi:hypothetical protein